MPRYPKPSDSPSGSSWGEGAQNILEGYHEGRQKYMPDTVPVFSCGSRDLSFSFKFKPLQAIFSLGLILFFISFYNCKNCVYGVTSTLV